MLLLHIFLTTRKSAFTVYYGLSHAKVKVFVSNFPLDICWRARASRGGNLETRESRSYKCLPQNFIKNTRPVCLSSFFATPCFSLYGNRGGGSGAPCIFDTLMHSLYIRKFFRKRHQMRAAFFKTERSVILLRDSTTNNARLGIKVVPTDRHTLYNSREKHNRVYLNTAICDGFTIRSHKVCYIFQSFYVMEKIYRRTNIVHDKTFSLKISNI